MGVVGHYYTESTEYDHSTDLSNMDSMASLAPGKLQSRTISEKIAESFFLALLFLLAFIANSTVCYVLAQSRRLRNPSNVFLFSLVLAGLSLTLLCLPFTLVAVITDRWPFGSAWCQISGLLLNVFTSASNLSVATIAISRYYLIVKPLSVKVSLKRAKTMTAFIWFCAFISALPPLFGWSAYRFSSGTGTCAVHWELGGPSLMYSLYLVTVCFLLPLGILVYAYRAIYKKAKRQRKKTGYNTLRGLGNGFLAPIPKTRSMRERLGCGCFGRSSSQSTLPSYSDKDYFSSPATSANSFSACEEIAGNTLPKMEPELKKQIISRTLSRQSSIYEQRTVQNAFFLITAFLLYLTPYYTVGLWSGLSQGTPSNVLHFVASFLFLSMSLVNPILYGYLNRQIRRLLRRFPVYRKIWKSSRRRKYDSKRHSSDGSSGTWARKNVAMDPD